MKSTTLREARTRKRWTQEELEARAGVDQSVISKLERGVSSSPRLDTVRKLEAALGLKPGQLVIGRVA